MQRCLSPRCRLLRSPALLCSKRRLYSTGNEGLRVLFCGSDSFSATSLARLVKARDDGSGLIRSIDVVCKSAKPTGRGLRNVNASPIKVLARSLALNLHEIPTFTGWTPPTQGESDSIIIAVSFGLKVPPRLLNGASFGGINLHPSLLPDLRGPAPLQHMLLRGDRTGGVTVQTLHPEKFDFGAIIAQREFELPNAGICSYDQLTRHAAVDGANLLVEALQNRHQWSSAGLFTNPPSSTSTELRHAPKVTPNDACIDWKTWSRKRLLSTQRALGTLWSNHTIRDRTVRIRWHGLKPIDIFNIEWTANPEPDNQTSAAAFCITGDGSSGMLRPITSEAYARISIGAFDGRNTDEVGDCAVMRLELDNDNEDGHVLSKRMVGLRCRDGGFVTPQSVTIEGRSRQENPFLILPQLMDRPGLL